jgi:hypothetical protein
VRRLSLVEASRRIDRRYAERDLRQLIEDARSLASRVHALREDVPYTAELGLISAELLFEQAVWDLRQAKRAMP